VRVFNKKLLIGEYAIVFGLIFWPAEALIHIFIFDEVSFYNTLFRPESHELWMRIMVSSAFIFFGFYANKTIAKVLKLNETIYHQQIRLRNVIDASHEAYVCFDAEGVIKDWNPMASQLFGWTRKEAVNSSILEKIIPERFHQSFRSGMQNYTKNGSASWVFEVIYEPLLHKRGEEFDVKYTIIPIDVNGSIEFYSFIRSYKQIQHWEGKF